MGSDNRTNLSYAERIDKIRKDRIAAQQRQLETVIEAIEEEIDTDAEVDPDGDTDGDTDDDRSPEAPAVEDAGSNPPTPGGRAPGAGQHGGGSARRRTGRTR